MSAVLLSVHVIVAILAVGPIAVAASMFPRYARDDGPVASALYRICRTYAVVGLAVPLLGIGTAVSMGVLTQAWVLISIGLTAVAAVILIAGILPDQRAALAGKTVTRLAMSTVIPRADANGHVSAANRNTLRLLAGATRPAAAPRRGAGR